MLRNGIRYALVLATATTPMSVAYAGYTHNIMLTGYWPPTNNMIRRYSTNPEQNPNGWIGQDWENRGYDIYSFFPEFPDGIGKGEGDLEVDYQDTSEDFWRIVEQVKPIAIITFSRGNFGNSWEIERRQRNLDHWINDYEAPYQPTPSPPDASAPAGHIRLSSLPMDNIRDAVNAADGLDVAAEIDNGFAGGFLSEFIAYHGVWYHSLHSDPSDDFWNVAAGHIHVGSQVSTAEGREATRITLRTLTDYLDTQVPEPGTLGLMAVAAAIAMGLRRTG